MCLYQTTFEKWWSTWKDIFISDPEGPIVYVNKNLPYPQV